MSQRDGLSSLQPQYRFRLTPYQYQDYEAMCHYQQTSAESHFTQRRVCSRATAEGRITLAEDRLIITSNGERKEQLLSDEAAYLGALYEHFGIVQGN
jgi:N-hydroxyarylamine O-acetyltransferase